MLNIFLRIIKLMESISDSFKKSCQLFTNFVEEIEKSKVSDAALRKSLKKYEVKNLKINTLTPLRAKKTFGILQQKYKNGATTKKNWLENERKVFVWCVICYTYQNSIEVEQFSQNDFDFFKALFPMKDLELIKFQIYNLIKKQNKNSGWSKEEDKALFRVREGFSDNVEQNIDWTTISKRFFTQTEEKYFRSSKQCRERWLNHLDPQKIKGKWTNEQDKILLEEVLRIGKKWSSISKILQGKKNEHTVKNRYKSLIGKKQKNYKNKNWSEEELILMIIDDIEKQIKQGINIQGSFTNDPSLKQTFEQSHAISRLLNEWEEGVEIKKEQSYSSQYFVMNQEMQDSNNEEKQFDELDNSQHRNTDIQQEEEEQFEENNDLKEKNVFNQNINLLTSPFPTWIQLVHPSWDEGHKNFTGYFEQFLEMSGKLEVEQGQKLFNF